MDARETNPPDPRCCPLCGRSNHCQLCTDAPYNGPCWCAKLDIPDALLAQIPPALQKIACVCRDCVTTFHRVNATAPGPAALPGEFYFEHGLVVFTEAYHLRRGYCCASGCRHCPYSAARS